MQSALHENFDAFMELSFSQIRIIIGKFQF
ncbi:hypothetical protein Q644_26215 [Brucella intermedia 229E]|uniref:Uncharacterized protein n=1 Tax=Brucella intermedia 229E TaxID=1337887 RepID=U4V769_9HYPH|nr:hypothetical protein Q644_26215 [Brucella intermedia 229E]